MVQIDTFLRLDKHPNIVRFHGVATESGGKIDTIFYLVMEYMPLGSLYDMLHRQRSQVLAEWLAWRSPNVLKMNVSIPCHDHCVGYALILVPYQCAISGGHEDAKGKEGRQ